MKPKLSPFRALKIKNFRNFWFAMLAFQLAMQMQMVAANWQMYILTHSAVNLGLLGLFGFLPVLLFSPFGGIAADKLSRKKIMVASQCALCLGSLVLAITTHLAVVTPVVLYSVIAFQSMILSFDLPARQSIVPSLVPSEYFVNAVSLTTILRQISTVLGPSIAGFLIEFFGVKSVYTLNAIAFMTSFTALLFIALPGLTHNKNVELSVSSVLEGMHFIRKSPLIYSTMILDFFATFFASATTLLPIFAADILKTGARGLGFLYAAPSAGAVIAGLFIASHHNMKNQGRILLIGIFVYGLATVAFGFSKSYLLSLVFLSLVGVGDMISTVIRNTIRQITTPDYLRGRMVAVNMIFFMGGPQLGETEGGLLAAAVGAPASVVIGGVGTIIATVLVAIFIPKLRKYQGHELAV
ncbi:MAG TPA: MFS transporter [Candidatus Saccharimonadales bacterium]|nr:MFS transporter [Candidatus Saccharimonadales bacterium]